MTAKDQSLDTKKPEVTPTSPGQAGIRGASEAELRPSFAKATEGKPASAQGSGPLRQSFSEASEASEAKPVVLIVIDGWGVAPPSQGNAIGRAKMRAWSRLTKDYLYGELIASGESVGLTANEVGSSGVGHLTIGAGRVVQLSVTKINQDIDDGSFMDNPALHVVKNQINQNESKLHLMGLIGVGTVHSSMKHLWAILDFCAENEIKEVYLHLFTDGRDSPPTAGKSVLAEVEEKLTKLGVGTIASIGGRYYGMDRDRRWERTQKTYDAIAEGKGHRAASAGEAMDYWHSKQVTDEFIEPTVMVRSTAKGNPSTAQNVTSSGRAQDDKTDLKSLSVLSSMEGTESTEREHSGSEIHIGSQRMNFTPGVKNNLRNLRSAEGEEVTKEEVGKAEVDLKLEKVKEKLETIKEKISDIANQDEEPLALVEPGDVVFFFNFRADRARQLTQMFCEKKPYRVMSNEQETGNNEKGEVLRQSRHGGIAQAFGSEAAQARRDDKADFKSVSALSSAERDASSKGDGLFVSMTNYHEDLRVDLSAYETAPVESPLSEAVSKAGIKQLHIAESEKERFVTYYFNGLRQEKFPGEDVVILPSPNVPTYDKKPEMALPEITQACLKGLRSREYGFVMMNFANPDMVAHSGNLRATTRACQYVDEALKAISEEVLKMRGTLVVTADHGNAEELLTLPRHSFFFTTSSGAMNTDHSNNPVPIVFVGQEFKGKGSLPKGGALADVGPTILSLLGLLPPAVMTGRNLLANSK